MTRQHSPSPLLQVKDFGIYLVTWNIGGVDAPNDLSNLLLLNHFSLVHPDLFGIAFQEMDSKPQSMVSDTLFTNSWTSAIRKILCEAGYVKISSVRLLGIFLIIFVKRKHVPFINHIQTNYTRTGLAGVWGNKGGVTISLNLYDRTISITNSHLAAHQNAYKERIDDCMCIIDSQVFKNASESIIEHDYIFWMGDLNFRLDQLDNQTIRRYIDARDYSNLIAYDQLKRALQEESLFRNFQEGGITFPPTYKFDKNSHLYDTSSKQRKPAWCDRIIWKVRYGSDDHFKLDLRQLSYNYHPAFKISDHKPVSATFKIRISNLKEELVKFDKPSHVWKIDHDASISYTISPNADVTNWDWIGLFKADFESLDNYETYIWVVRENYSEEKCTAKISGQYIKNPGNYRLLFISKRYECAFGMSEPFPIVAWKLDNK